MLTPTITRSTKIRTAGKIQGAGRSLAMRRVWFADEAQDAEGGEQQKKADADPGKADDGDGDDDALAKMSSAQLAEKLRELRRENGKWRTQLREKEKSETALLEAQAQQERERKAAADKELEEQGNYKKLYEQQQTELEQLREKAKRADAFEQTLKAKNEARIALIPESKRKLVPTGYSPEALAEWLDAAEGELSKPQPPNLDSGKKGEGKNRQDPKQILKPIRM